MVRRNGPTHESTVDSKDRKVRGAFTVIVHITQQPRTPIYSLLSADSAAEMFASTLISTFPRMIIVTRRESQIRHRQNRSPLRNV